MADYTYKELMKMQNDAIRRAEDMNKRAQKTAGLPSTNTQEKGKIPLDEPRRIPMPANYPSQITESDSSQHQLISTHPQTQKAFNFTEQIKNIFKDISIDSDRALLLSLILLLSEEKGDEALIMALIYML